MRSAILFGTGYLGVTHIGDGYRKAMQQQEATKILSEITRLTKKDLPQALMTPELIELEESARHQVNSLESIAKDKTRSFDRITKAIERFEVAKDKFLTSGPKSIGARLSPGAEKTVKELVDLVGNYQAKYLKAARQLHPVMGYFAATTFIGLPLVTILRHILAPQKAIEEREYRDNYGSFWLGRTLKGLGDMVGLGHSRYQQKFQQGPYTRNY